VVKGSVQLWCCPAVPAESAVDDGGVGLTVQFSPVAAFGFKVMQVLEELDPRNLFNVIQFGCNAVLGPKGALDAVEGVFLHQIPPVASSAVTHLP